jgi:hypothetical protein
MGAKIIKKLSIGKLPCFFSIATGIVDNGVSLLEDKKNGVYFATLQ